MWQAVYKTLTINMAYPCRCMLMYNSALVQVKFRSNAISKKFGVTPLSFRLKCRRVRKLMPSIIRGNFFGLQDNNHELKDQSTKTR